MATRMPSSAPRATTPTSATIERQNSERRTLQNQRRLGRSNNRNAAAITMAASVDCGMFRPIPLSVASTTRIASAPTTAASCVLDPADRATAVRVADAPTGKPWNNPAAAFERPSATISRFASRCSPRCAEMLRDSAVKSANVTNAKPGRRDEQCREVVEADGREGRGREPGGDRSDHGDPVPGQAEHRRRRGGTDDGEDDPGHPRAPAAAHEDHPEGCDADDERRDDSRTLSQAAHERVQLVVHTGRGRGEAEQLRELAHEHDDRDPVEEADADRLGEELGEDADPGEPGRDAEGAHQQREQAGERDGPGRIAVGTEERQQRGGDHGAERRVGAEHEEPRRPEERVGEQGDHRRVQAGDRREPGERRVRHALRHEQDGQHQAGDDVLPRPTPFVAPRHDDARDPVEDLANPSDCSVGHGSSVHLGAVLGYGRWSRAVAIAVAEVLRARHSARGPRPTGPAARRGPRPVGPGRPRRGRPRSR